MLTVWAFEDGKLCRFELFGDDQFHQAQARFDELSAPPPKANPLRNNALNVLARLVELLFDGRRYDEIEALAPGLQYESRRLTGASMGFVDMLRSFDELGIRAGGVVPVATRGDLLALARPRLVLEGDAVVEALFVVQTDAAGRITHIVGFEDDAFDLAYAELNHRYLSGDGAAGAAPARTLFTAIDAYNRRDWPAALALFADDAAVADHRPPPSPYAGVRDASELAGIMAKLMAETPTLTLRAPVIHAVSARAGFCSLVATAQLPTGGSVEIGMLNVWAVTESGIQNFELFGEDQFDEAQARFEELGRDDHLNVESWKPVQRLIDGYNSRDWDRVLSAAAEDCVIVDERMTGWGTLDRDSFLDRMQELVRIAPDVKLRGVKTHLMLPTGVAARFQVAGNVPGGGEFTMSFEVAATVRDGVFTALTLLPENQEGDAVERLRSAGAGSEPTQG